MGLLLPGQRPRRSEVWLAKVIYEVAATPLTYAVVTWLKRKEGMDAYDVNTSYNPLVL